MTTFYHGITLIVNKQNSEPSEIRGWRLEATSIVLDVRCLEGRWLAKDKAW
jgi:hypothetical protein